MKHVSQQIQQTVGRALGRIPSGVFVLTTVHDGRGWAMLASWVQQAGFEPPAVSVAIGKERAIAEAIRGAGAFALSMVGDQDRSLMKRYARGIKAGEDPFAGVATVKLAGGGVVLADALGYLECRVKAVCEIGGDHEIYVGEVVAGEVFKEGHGFVHHRGSGFHY